MAARPTASHSSGEASGCSSRCWGCCSSCSWMRAQQQMVQVRNQPPPKRPSDTRKRWSTQKPGEHPCFSLSVTADADVLGRSFQGNAAVRALSEADHLRLLAYAENLPLEPRARLLPEERLEALLLAGDENAVARLLHDEPAGIAEERRRYLMLEAVRRDRDLVDHLRDLYAGECQICGWAPRTQYGAEI